MRLKPIVPAVRAALQMLGAEWLAARPRRLVQKLRERGA